MKYRLIVWPICVLSFLTSVTYAGQDVDSIEPPQTQSPRVSHRTTPAIAGLVDDAPKGGAKDIREGDNLFFRISSTEPTRLSIEGGRIAALNYVSDDLEVQQDTVLGQAYIKPRTLDKSLTLYVTTNADVTATLTLQPTPGPASSIRLRDVESLRARALTEHASQPKQSVLPVASEYAKSIESLMTVAAKGLSVSGIETAALNQSVNLWQGVDFTLRAKHIAQNMVVETYDLQNTSSEILRMVEQEFYTSSVAGVAIERHELLPGESTRVFVARWVRE